MTLLRPGIQNPRAELHDVIKARRGLMPYRRECPAIVSILTRLARELITLIRKETT